MAFVNENFVVRRGDDRLVEIEIEDELGGDVDLTGLKIELTYGKSGGKALVTKTQADLKVAGKLATFRMRPADTRALEAYRVYWMRAKVTFLDGTTDGFRDTVMTASFSVDEE